MAIERKIFPLALTHAEKVRLDELSISYGFDTSSSQFLRWIIRTMSMHRKPLQSPS